MAIYFLDADDEVTSAAARIRDSSDTRIALVLSGGSRVATSRINFRVLAREAQHRHKRLAIVAPDMSVRSVAQSAGLPVFATVGEYEKSEAARLIAGVAGAGEVSSTLDELGATIEPAAAPPRERPWSGATRVVGSGGVVVAGSSTLRPAEASRTASRMPRTAATLVAIALLLTGAIGLAVFWPSATVVLTLKEEAVGPVSLTVKVDPAALTADDASATVPGKTTAIAVAATAEFKATGQSVVETAATGTVTFTNTNNDTNVPVPAGTQVSTASGIAFTTTSAVIVPKATQLSANVQTPGHIDAPIVAVRKGLSGNVSARAIVNMPAAIHADLHKFGSVKNASPTTGGTHAVTPKIQQSDLDIAKANLTIQLNDAFQAKLADPATAPAGFELFAKTAQLGDPTFSPDPANLLNQGVATFQLGAAGAGTATVADLNNVRSLAERLIKNKVKSGYTLVDGSVSVLFGTVKADGANLSVPVTARASQVANLNPDDLRAVIEGKTVDEAKAYLSKYGKADISLSPGWGGIPGFGFRIDIQLVAPVLRPSGSASAKPGSHAASTPATSGSPIVTGPVTTGSSALPSSQASPSAGVSPTSSPTAGATASAAPTAT